MNARVALNKYGKKLIGLTIATEKIGGYPGGLAEVIEIDPDPAAPEIVMTVKHSWWKDDEGKSTMGIFDHEDVVLPAKME